MSLPLTTSEPGSDGFIDLGTLPVPPPTGINSMTTNNGDTSDWSDGDETFTSPLELMEQMKNGGSMLIGQIKKQEYKHPQEQEVKDLKTVQEDGMDITGHIGDDLAGDDLNLPTPDAFLEASEKQQSPKSDWRSHLSDSLLSTLPGPLRGHLRRRPSGWLRLLRRVKGRYIEHLRLTAGLWLFSPCAIFEILNFLLHRQVLSSLTSWRASWLIAFLLTDRRGFPA